MKPYHIEVCAPLKKKMRSLKRFWLKKGLNLQLTHAERKQGFKKINE